MFRKLRRLVAYIFVKALVGSAEVLPRKAGVALFGALGSLAYSVLPGSRRVALANLKLVYGECSSHEELERTARAAFRNLGRICYDFARMRKQTRESISSIAEIKGRHHLDRALARGKGVIGLTGHIGNWELMGAYFALNGYPLNVLATRMNNAPVNRELLGLRRSAGLKVLERSGELMGAVRALRRGEMLGVLVDLDTSVESVIVDFLGRPAKTAAGYVKLATVTGASLVPMAMLLRQDGRYEIQVHEPVEISGNGDSLESDVQECSRAVEDFIRQEPTQWIWMHKRWKSVCSEIYA
jgi:KDO2-lipid IV(A) lauroyltransferase